jgi:hypothetical protein
MGNPCWEAALRFASDRPTNRERMRARRLAVLKYIITELKVAPNARLVDGSLPIIRLIIENDHRAIALFLQNGLDLREKMRGRTLWQIAKEVAPKETLAVLQSFVRDPPGMDVQNPSRPLDDGAFPLLFSCQ